MRDDYTYRIVVAGGGTGGHLFPAIAVVEELKLMMPEIDVLFMGTKKRMESEILPKLGYRYKGTSIKGLPRKVGVNILSFVISLIVAIYQSFFELIKFRPNVALGTGSYISFPPLFAAKVLGSKIFLVESNSYPGLATKVLFPFAQEIYITFEQTKKYFKDTSKFVVTGTPIRRKLTDTNRLEAANYFNLSPEIKTIVVLGGSLGAKNINEKLVKIYKRLSEKYQIIWQTGKVDYDIYKDLKRNENVVILPFIDRMEYAYAMSDLLISRSGASTIAEIIENGIPSILIPSPNVTENHQYHNAMELVKGFAAEIHLDNQSAEELYDQIIKIMNDNALLKTYAVNVKRFSRGNSARIIAERIIKFLEEQK